jgi:acyl-CoA synthetase (NDP forming)
MNGISEPDFDLLFNPSSIALIGASNNIGKWGAIIFLNILLGGYPGRLYPVNPKEEKILGHKAYGRVTQISDPVDLAIIAIPAHLILESVQDCICKGIRMAIVITSDFSETGEAGAKLEKELTAMARAAGLRLVGPNTMGIFSSAASLTALMPPVRPRKGGVSLVSQSGNIGTQMLGWGEKFGVGFSKYVSGGNEGDLRSEDYLGFLGQDPETRVILLYIEGLDDGRGFFEKARKITPHKPIVAFKGGRTLAGSRAAKSHSGAMAGVKKIYEAAFRQAGILWASTPEEMLEWGAAFSSLPPLRGNRVAILTRGGGWGVITADACNEVGLEVPPLDGSIIRSLDRLLPSYWSRGNPVDMVATIRSESYMECLELLISWDEVDGVISLSGHAGPLARIIAEVRERGDMIRLPEQLENIAQKVSTGGAQIYQRVCELVRKYRKPIFALGPNVEGGNGSSDSAVAQFRTPEGAAKAAGALYQYNRYRKSIGMEEETKRNNGIVE